MRGVGADPGLPGDARVGGPAGRIPPQLCSLLVGWPCASVSSCVPQGDYDPAPKVAARLEKGCVLSVSATPAAVSFTARTLSLPVCVGAAGWGPGTPSWISWPESCDCGFLAGPLTRPPRPPQGTAWSIPGPETSVFAGKVWGAGHKGSALGSVLQPRRVCAATRPGWHPLGVCEVEAPTTPSERTPFIILQLREGSEGRGPSGGHGRKGGAPGADLGHRAERLGSAAAAGEGGRL